MQTQKTAVVLLNLATAANLLKSLTNKKATLNPVVKKDIEPIPVQKGMENSNTEDSLCRQENPMMKRINGGKMTLPLFAFHAISYRSGYLVTVRCCVNDKRLDLRLRDGDSGWRESAQNQIELRSDRLKNQRKAGSRDSVLICKVLCVATEYILPKSLKNEKINETFLISLTFWACFFCTKGSLFLLSCIPKKSLNSIEHQSWNSGKRNSRWETFGCMVKNQ